MINHKISLKHHDKVTLHEEASLGLSLPLMFTHTHYVALVTGKPPVMMRPKDDGSFLVKFSTREEAELFVTTKVPFLGTKTILLEPWSPQKDSGSTEFKKKFMWVQLLGLREEFFELAGDLLTAVGEVVIRPKLKEF